MILQRDFYTRDVLEVAPGLIGKILSVNHEGSAARRLVITEVEAYRGTDDKACHASRGKTPRNRVMFDRGGLVYMYFVYGMYWMLNIVTGQKDNPQAALIRGVEGITGPGRLTRDLGLDGSFYGEDLTVSQRITVEDGIRNCSYTTGPRIGIDYSGEPWKSMPWRYVIDGSCLNSQSRQP